jgi:predicted Zn finger-like uncharacterized protein
MILTCPNCRARYAVDPQKIGPAGRTVQCARCDQRWFEKLESPPSAPPEMVIRPTTSGASLPAVIPPKPPFPWGRVIAVAVALVVLIAATLFAFRHKIAAMVSYEARASSATPGAAPPPAPSSPARAPVAPPPRPQIEVDLASSTVDVIDGRYVVRGTLVNNGSAAGSTSLLRVTFKRNDDVLGERSFPMVEGPLLPGGRASFSQTLDDPPPGTTDIVPVVE